MVFLEKFDATPPEQQLPFLVGALRQDAVGFLAELRAKRPFLSVPPNVVMVTRRPDVEEVLNHNTVFTVKPYAPKMDPSVGPFMLAFDNTVFNQRDKGIMRALIQQSDMVEVRETVAKLTKAAIASSVSTDGSLDIVAHLTRNVPVRLTGAYFGFPGPDEESMLRWSRATQTDMFYNVQNDPAIHAACVEAGEEMKAYLQSYLPKKLDEISNDSALDDVVARMLKMEMPSSIGFDMSRVMTNIMGLLVGGIETTSAAIAQATYALLERPVELKGAIKAAVAGDDATFNGYVWEALRFLPQSPFVGRLSEAPYKVAAGTDRAFEISLGSYVLASHASAMDDEIAQPDVVDFKTDRPNWWYMHLGYGYHRCLGDQVSESRVPEIIKQVLLAGFTKRADGPAGEIDFKGGVFPESFSLVKG